MFHVVIKYADGLRINMVADDILDAVRTASERGVVESWSAAVIG